MSNVVYLLMQPHSPDNRALARECKDVKIDRVYIGSCTGGKTEDFLAAAKVFLASVRAISIVTFFRQPIESYKNLLHPSLNEMEDNKHLYHIVVTDWFS